MITLKGGAVLIDTKGLELTTQTSVTINGLYENIEKAVKAEKPIFAYNVEFEGYKVSPIAVFANKRPSGNFICTASTLQIEVTDDDEVTIHNMIV